MWTLAQKMQDGCHMCSAWDLHERGVMMQDLYQDRWHKACNGPPDGSMARFMQGPCQSRKVDWPQNRTVCQKTGQSAQVPELQGISGSGVRKMGHGRTARDLRHGLFDAGTAGAVPRCDCGRPFKAWPRSHERSRLGPSLVWGEQASLA